MTTDVSHSSGSVAVPRWDPEDSVFWAKEGARQATRTLWITTVALMLSFATWFMWSAIVVRLPDLGFQLSLSQRFWLAALPGLAGATLRIPYSFLIQIFGTRKVVTIATATLLIPSIGVGLAVRNPDTPLWLLYLLAVSAGFGGGNFAAFMSSTTYFYPKARQGTALGIQAGVGNFGVSLAQFLIPAVIGVSIFGALGGDPLTSSKTAKSIWVQNGAFIWAVPVVLLTVAAALWLRSVPVTATFRQQAVIFKRKHNWTMTSLYIMTFGSFSGFAASFALLIREVFGKVPNPPDPLQFAFLGALVGSAVRPPGGWISDKIGGAIVTMFSGALLLAGAIAVTFFTAPTSRSDFWPFLLLMLLIFFAAGVGNGSTFRMIPVIFPRNEAGPVIGWTSAIGAYGSFIVPMLFGWAISSYGSPNVAFLLFAAFYAANLVLCWWYYARRGAEKPC